jgi:branched-chain amino acid transport system ATP-binding protein
MSLMDLVVQNINSFYGLSHILFDVSLEVDRGEVVVLLGRNGAGKTTTMLSIMGLNPPKSGRVIYRGQDITGWASYKIARRGIGYVPEDRKIFPDLTVLGNLDVGRRVPKGKAPSWPLTRIYELFPVLKDFSHRAGGTLSGGQRQMLTIARTLMGNPELLLLDEPTEGLAPLVVKMLGEFLEVIKREGVTVLLSEQNLKFALAHADRAYIVDNGIIKYQGSIKELSANDEVKKKYLAV